MLTAGRDRAQIPAVPRQLRPLPGAAGVARYEYGTAPDPIEDGRAAFHADRSVRESRRRPGVAAFRAAALLEKLIPGRVHRIADDRDLLNRAWNVNHLLPPDTPIARTIQRVR